jgi:hypothetical protein
MFKPTNNPYQFQYLVTKITGEGIKEVYLPPVPKESKIHFKAENKWVRPQPSQILKTAISEYSKRIRKDKYYVHPMQHAINAWAEQERQRTIDGFWFWNKGVATYITPFHYWYLTAWLTYFGYPDYREPDKEICYFILYCEEDPNCFGGILNTIRRYGKSSLMGAWATFRTTRNFGHFTGMQGETDKKVGAFYTVHIKKPFRKLPFYFTPVYDTSSALTSDIRFEQQPDRGKKAYEESADEEDVTQLESYIEYRESSEGAYDQAVLHTYLMEEPGKTLGCNISNRWDTVKPCLRRGVFIRGKALLGTTVEFMDTAGKGGRAYKILFYESDFDAKQKDGRTTSGLYASFLPGDCAYEGFFDEWGHPMRKQAKEQILIERESVKKNAKKLSALIRKYPLSVKEIFYINAENCEFNAQVLQDRKSELDALVDPIVTRGRFEWENKVRFSRAIFKHDDMMGWASIHSLIAEKDKQSLVEKTSRGGKDFYGPLNNDKFAAGFDPIDHGVQVEGRTGDDEMTDGRRSRPVLFIKRKYDSSIDGIVSQEILEQRAEERYEYKTNRYVAMMDVRPNDPNVLFERVLLMLWYFGVSVHVESQKPGVMNYLYNNNCGDFVLGKYTPESAPEKRSTTEVDGTPASGLTIGEYTDALATYVEYFGHTIPFPELLEDLLLFKPKKTTEFDYAVGAGFTELACKIKPKKVQVPVVDIHDFMPGYDDDGNVVC